MSSLIQLMKESTQDPHLITIEATVPSGFEYVAMEECNEKLGKSTNPAIERGRIFFNISSSKINDVDCLRSVDNLYVLIKQECNLHLTENDLDESINILKKLVIYEDVCKAISIWSLKSGFSGIIYPSKEQYTSAKEAELELKSLARKSAETRFASDEMSAQLTSKQERTKLNVFQQEAYNEIDSRKEEEKVLKYRVTCIRNGNHPFTSEQAAHHVGGQLQDIFNWVVDLRLYDTEFILNVRDDSAYYGIALTKESKHNRNITSFGPTTLRATVCYNMLKLAKPKPGDIVIDPMCGGGSIPIEGISAFLQTFYICGDIHEKAVSRTEVNLEHLNAKTNHIDVFSWDSTHLPLKDSTVDIFVTDLPFGKRSGSLYDNRILYKNVLVELGRVVRCKSGQAVLLTCDKKNMRNALLYAARIWTRKLQLNINIGGLSASVFVLTRSDKAASVPPTKPSRRHAKKILKTK